jgi:hypothetical protein
VSVVGLKKLMIETSPGNEEEVLDFTYFDPHPDYKRAVHVRVPSYYTREQRTKLGWHARFRWWEVKPDWTRIIEQRDARMAGTVAGSRYVAGTTETEYLPNWLLKQPDKSPEEIAANYAGALVGSDYVYHRPSEVPVGRPGYGADLQDGSMESSPLSYSSQGGFGPQQGRGASSGGSRSRDVWVNSYQRRDGTHVRGHWRSRPSR